MPYNNYNAYANQGVVNPRVVPVQSPGVNVNAGWGGYSQAPQQSSDGRVYVNGRAGADAYPLPMGVNVMILWDTDARRFYIKGYDNNGMPRVLEDNDYSPHSEPEPEMQQNLDMSSYATKEDIQKMRNDFDSILSQLAVGNGGRIVRMNESNG